MSSDTRVERDSMGALEVPREALYGAQTQRAVNNFPISGLPLPHAFLQALLQVKAAAARANVLLGQLDADTGAFKRMWGAFGNTPLDPPPGQPERHREGQGPQQFGTVHGVKVSNDGLGGDAAPQLC